jgi:hypothetical protein
LLRESIQDHVGEPRADIKAFGWAHKACGRVAGDLAVGHQGDRADQLLVGSDLVDEEHLHLAPLPFTPCIPVLVVRPSPATELVPAPVDGDGRLGRAGIRVLDLSDRRGLDRAGCLGLRRTADFAAEAGAG